MTELEFIETLHLAYPSEPIEISFDTKEKLWVVCFNKQNIKAVTLVGCIYMIKSLMANYFLQEQIIKNNA